MRPITHSAKGIIPVAGRALSARKSDRPRLDLIEPAAEDQQLESNKSDTGDRDRYVEVVFRRSGESLRKRLSGAMTQGGSRLESDQQHPREWNRTAALIASARQMVHAVLATRSRRVLQKRASLTRGSS
jgi:hypothetical protein